MYQSPIDYVLETTIIVLLSLLLIVPVLVLGYTVFLNQKVKVYIPQAEVKQKTVRVICENKVVLPIATLTHEDPKYFYVEIMNERYKYPKNLCFHLDLKSPEYK